MVGYGALPILRASEPYEAFGTRPTAMAMGRGCGIGDAATDRREATAYCSTQGYKALIGVLTSHQQRQKQTGVHSGLSERCNWTRRPAGGNAQN